MKILKNFKKKLLIIIKKTNKLRAVKTRLILMEVQVEVPG
jgi:hypothetical protein